MSIPSRLYKYHAYSSYALESMVQKKIWVSKPAQFNDPFDCKLRVKDAQTLQQFEDLNSAVHRVINRDPSNPDRRWTWNVYQGKDEAPSVFMERLRHSAEQQLEVLTKVGVYSTSSKRDDLLMWAHYADHHRGFVIGFDTSTLQDNYHFQLVQVEYVDEYREMDIAAIVDFENVAQRLRKVATRKGRRWELENEWRLVYDWPLSNCLVDMPMSPTEVIFGDRMPQSHRTTLQQIVSSNFPEAQFFLATPSSSKFALDIVGYSSA